MMRSTGARPRRRLARRGRAIAGTHCPLLTRAASGCFTSWAMDALSSPIVMTRDKWASSACALRRCWPEQELRGSATA